MILHGGQGLFFLGGGGGGGCGAWLLDLVLSSSQFFRVFDNACSGF